MEVDYRGPASTRPDQTVNRYNHIKAVRKKNLKQRPERQKMQLDYHNRSELVWIAHLNCLVTKSVSYDIGVWSTPQFLRCSMQRKREVCMTAHTISTAINLVNQTRWRALCQNFCTLIGKRPILLQCILAYPNLDYPKPCISEQPKAGLYFS